MAILSIPVTKAGSALSIETDDIPASMYELALKEGLKVLLNKGMSKIVFKGLDENETAKAKADALEIGEKNLANLMAGKIKAGRAASTSKVPAAVMVEARRLAKDVVKAEIRKAGMKISLIPAKDITAAANQLIERDASFIATAKANIEARANTVVTAIDIGSLVHEDSKLKAKADAEKAERKSQLSAKQAGKPKAAPRKGSSPTA